MITLEIVEETFPLAQSFNISRGAKTEAKIVRVIARDGKHQGQGECVPYARYGESVTSVCEQIKSLPKISSREELQSIMPAGAARNAIDCALWDLEAKQCAKPVWQLAGLTKPKAVTTAYTISLDSPQEMQANAEKNAFRPLLKIKLGTEEDVARLEAVRLGAPEAKIIVDANEGWSLETFSKIQPQLQRLNIALVEQPLPENDDHALENNRFDIPLCADESSHTSEGLEKLVGKYDFINIKLDKTGGLTEALKMKARAEELGLGIFVGCLVATSLAMAPALLLAQGAEYVDLDGPLLLAQDRDNGLRFEGSLVHPADEKLWS